MLPLFLLGRRTREGGGDMLGEAMRDLSHEPWVSSRRRSGGDMPTTACGSHGPSWWAARRLAGRIEAMRSRERTDCGDTFPSPLAAVGSKRRVSRPNGTTCRSEKQRDGCMRSGEEGQKGEEEEGED